MYFEIICMKITKRNAIQIQQDKYNLSDNTFAYEVFNYFYVKLVSYKYPNEKIPEKSKFQLP